MESLIQYEVHSQMSCDTYFSSWVRSKFILWKWSCIPLGQQLTRTEQQTAEWEVMSWGWPTVSAQGGSWGRVTGRGPSVGQREAGGWGINTWTMKLAKMNCMDQGSAFTLLCIWDFFLYVNEYNKLYSLSHGTSIPNLSVYPTTQNSAAGLCVVVYYSETGRRCNTIGHFSF